MARTFRRSTSRFSRRRRYRRGFARNLFRPTRFSRASAVGLGGTSYVSSVKNMLLAIDWKSGQNASTIKRWAPLGLPKSGADISRIPTIQGHDQRFYQLLMLYDKVRIRSCSFELVVPVPAGTAIKATDDAQGDTDQLQFGLGGISIVSRFIRAGTKDTDVSNLGASASQLSVPGVVVTRSRNKDGYLMLRYNFAPRNAAEMNSWWSCRVYSAQDSSLAEWVAGAYKDFSPIIDFMLISAYGCTPSANVSIPIQIRVRTVFEFRNGYVSEPTSTAQQIQEMENQVKVLKAQAPVYDPLPVVEQRVIRRGDPDAPRPPPKKPRSEARRVETATRQAPVIQEGQTRVEDVDETGVGMGTEKRTYWIEEPDDPDDPDNAVLTQAIEDDKKKALGWRDDPNCGLMCHITNEFNDAVGKRLGRGAGNLLTAGAGAVIGAVGQQIARQHAAAQGLPAPPAVPQIEL